MALPSCPIAPSPLSPLQDAPDEPQGNEHSCSAGSRGCLQGTGCASGGTGDADPNPLWKAQLRPSSVTSTSCGIEGTLTQLMCDRTVPLQHGFQVPITTSQSLLPQNSSTLACPCACSSNSLLLGCHQQPLNHPHPPPLLISPSQLHSCEPAHHL